MIIRSALAVSLLALAACQPASAPAPEAPAMQQPETAAANCDLTVERAWGPIGPSDHPSYRVKVWTTGSVCESSVVTLAVFARDGFPIYTWAGAAQYLFALRDAKNPMEMSAALNEWIGPDNQPPQMTTSLPPWDETDGQSRQTEFPFMPNLEKSEYEELRKADRHMLCYPQGIESQLCLALWQDADSPPSMEEIGIWRFPG